MFYIAQIENELSKGYTQASLNYIKALQTQKVNFELLPLAHMVQWDQKPFWIKDSSYYFGKTQSSREVTLTHITPSDLLKVQYKGSKKSIGLTTFETTKLPAWIVGGLNSQYDGLIVPSLYNKESLLSSGIKIPVEVVEHAIGDWWLDLYEEKSETPYVFGYVGGWNVRKNPELILDTFLDMFPKEQEEYALFLKTFTDFRNADRIKTKISNRSDIWFYNESWTEEQMAWGYSQIDCFVSAHKGEGFGLNIAQAQYLNKPVIFTNYSAPAEWLSQEHNYPVDFLKETAEVNSNLYQYFKTEDGSKLHWASPDRIDLRSKMTLVAGTRPQKAMDEASLKSFRERFSWEKIGKDLVSAVESISGLTLERI